MRKNEFTISCHIYWNAQTRAAFTVPELLSIILKNEILKASNFINIRLFSRIFQKQILFFFSKSFTGCYDQNTVFLVISAWY